MVEIRSNRVALVDAPPTIPLILLRQQVGKGALLEG